MCHKKNYKNYKTDDGLNNFLIFAIDKHILEQQEVNNIRLYTNKPWFRMSGSPVGFKWLLGCFSSYLGHFTGPGGN